DPPSISQDLSARVYQSGRLGKRGALFLSAERAYQIRQHLLQGGGAPANWPCRGLRLDAAGIMRLEQFSHELGIAVAEASGLQGRAPVGQRQCLRRHRSPENISEVGGHIEGAIAG